LGLGRTPWSLNVRCNRHVERGTLAATRDAVRVPQTIRALRQEHRMLPREKRLHLVQKAARCVLAVTWPDSTGNEGTRSRKRRSLGSLADTGTVCLLAEGVVS
ncbi:uncharacterized, partial [Tachysurus ichikawai]